MPTMKEPSSTLSCSSSCRLYFIKGERMEQERQFKGIWIDKDVWLDTRLNALEKIILMEIDSLDNEETGCYASNKYLAEFCQCSECKVSLAITKLIKLEYLELKNFDGRTRILKSRLLNFKRQDYKNLKADIEILKDNNIDKINKNNNYKYIVDYLNEKADVNFRSSAKETQALINARFSDGFEEQDFIKVIDNMVASWKGTELEQYLRPKTLFGTKFESYLNVKQKATNKRTYSKAEMQSMFTDIDDIAEKFKNF